MSQPTSSAREPERPKRGARHFGTATRWIREDIERALRTRRAEPGTLASHVEARAKGGGERAWSALRDRPSIGAVAVGGVVLTVAMEVGFGELALAIAAGYATYKILRGVPVDEAIAEAKHLVE